MQGSAAPDTGGVVLGALHCRRCGYNLYGLPAEGACPECGLAAWETILHTVDPASSRLPRLRDARAVGNALLWLTVCLLLAALLAAARPVMLWLEEAASRRLIEISALTPAWLSPAAALPALAGLWSVWRLAPARGSDAETAVQRDLRLLGGGLLGWAAAVAAVNALTQGGAPAWAPLAAWLAAAVAAAASLMGLGGVLRSIGLRSREYRTARGGRQGAQAMVAAVGGAGAGLVLRLVGTLGPGLDSLATVGSVLTATCTLMIVVGLLYLVVNAWWIRRSLRCPPPRLEEILGPPADQ